MLNPSRYIKSAIVVSLILIGICIPNSSSWSQDQGNEPSLPSPIGTTKGISFELFLGRKLFSEAKYDKAIKLLQIARSRGETTGRDLALIGIAYYKLKKPKEARKTLEEAKKQYPQEPLIYIGLAYLAFEKKEYSEALRLFQKAQTLKPNLREAKNGLVATYINMGVEAYAKGNPQKAENLFKRALDVKPDSVEALTNIGIIKQDENKIDEAISYFTKALKYKSNNAKILKFLAESLKIKKGLRSKELLFVLKRLANAAPFSPYPFEQLGRVYERMGKKEEAFKAFSSAYERNSEDPYIYYWLANYNYNNGEKKKVPSLLYLAIGKAVQKIGMIQIGAAKRIDQKKGKLTKEDLKALKKLGTLMEEPKELLHKSIALLHRVRKSKKDFEKDMEKLSSWYPHSTDIKVAYAKFLEKQNSLQKALNIWLEIVEKHPYNTEAHLGLARIYQKTDKTAKAISQCKRAIDIDDKNEEAYRLLIDLYLKANNPKGLISFLEDRFQINKYNKVLINQMIKTYTLINKTEEAKKMRKWLDHVSELEKRSKEH